MTTPVATLLPLTSVKNFLGAVKFLSWLEKNHQQGWQMLPLSEPVATPYRNQGIGIASFFYDNGIPKKYRTWLLTRDEFVAANEAWLPDYALYRAVSDHFQTSKWWTWPESLARFQPRARNAWRGRLALQIEAYVDEQYFLTNQFLHLKAAARQRGVMLIGDLPFYLAQESSLVWANQDLFLLSRDGSLPLQSGVPVSKDEPFRAQFWQHPLYNWATGDLERLEGLFLTRLKFLSQFFELVRFDHANGFFRYGLMSVAHPAWSKKVDGPGREFLLHLLMQVRQLQLGIYFEDIASEKMRLEQFMKELKVAGMDVLTLRYNLENTDSKAAMKITDAKLRLSNFKGNKVIFTSNHDTPPLITWVKGLPPVIKRRLLRINGWAESLTDRALAIKIRRQLLATPARLVVVPWQDWQLDDFRFNVPGREDLTNWDYYPNID